MFVLAPSGVRTRAVPTPDSPARPVARTITDIPVSVTVDGRTEPAGTLTWDRWGHVTATDRVKGGAHALTRAWRALAPASHL